MTKESSRSSQIKIVVVFIIPLLVLLPGLAGFPYPPGGEYSDLTVTHYPNAIFLRNTIQAFHTIPLWSPTILSGYPFAANPLSGLWYPPGWITLPLPLPFGFNLLILLHLLGGGVGMYLLLRQEGLSRGTAIFGGLAFEAMPKLIAHYGAGHISLIYAVTWTPWLLYTYRYRVMDDTHQRSNWCGWLCQPGLVLALILLADVRWGYYAGVLWWGYAFAHSYQSRQRTGIIKLLNFLIYQSLIGILMAAPLLLPFAEYMRLSTRMGVKPDNLFIFSLPPIRLFGLLFPDFGGFYEWVLYPGGVVTVLALLGWGWRGAKNVIRFWQLIVLISLVLSFGAHLPGMELVTSFPGLNLLRVPSRWLFITGIGFAALAAHCLERIGNGLEPITKKRLNLALVALSMLALTWSVAVWGITKEFSPSNLWGTFIIMAGSICIYLLINWRRLYRTGVLLLILFCTTDLMVTNLSLFESKTAEIVLAQASAEATRLDEEGGLYRIYTPSFSMPQHIAVHHGFQLINGVDPLQLSAYVDFMEQASGVPISGYSVVLPPIADGNPATANSAYRPDPFLLGLLNVKFVLAAYPLQVEGLSEEYIYDSSILYNNHEVRPRAWIQPLEVPAGEEISPVDISVYQPNRIDVEAEGPGLLVLSEIMYPGWRAQVDGEPVEIQSAMGILRSVALDEGNHLVRFKFLPVSMLIGMILWGLGVVLLVLGTRRRVR